jgi:hypothetical protein
MGHKPALIFVLFITFDKITYHGVIVSQKEDQHGLPFVT